MKTVLSCDSCNCYPDIGTQTDIKCSCGGRFIVKGTDSKQINSMLDSILDNINDQEHIIKIVKKLKQR